MLRLFAMTSWQLSYPLLADLIVLIHVAFVIFAILGGFLVAWRPRLIWIHLPAVIWAAIVEFFGCVCPLTPLENWLRRKAESDGYASDFIAHYFLPILYPQGLTREAQIVLGILAVVINLAIYGWVLRKKTRARDF